MLTLAAFVLSIAVLFWWFAKSRDLAGAEAKLRKTQGSKRLRFTRSALEDPETAQEPVRGLRREFGKR